MVKSNPSAGGLLVLEPWQNDTLELITGIANLPTY